MNLEQLQAMSDAELNELSAVKVMGWKREDNQFIDENGNRTRDCADVWNHPDVWNPTTDMNDATEIQNALNDDELHSYTLRLMKMTSAFGSITYRDVTNILKSSAKDRVIAAILSKEDNNDQ